MAKVSRQNNRETYIIRTALGNYAVTIWRIKNDVNGNPRWEANIAVIGKWEMTADDRWFTVSYRFTGHYYNAHGEADWIVGHFEEENRYY